MGGHRNFAIRSLEDVEGLRRVREALCIEIDRKVALIVNYDGFRLDEMVDDAYFAMAAELQEKYYTTATGYTTSAFMRMKLGEGLAFSTWAPGTDHLPKSAFDHGRMRDAWTSSRREHERGLSTA